MDPYALAADVLFWFLLAVAGGVLYDVVKLSLKATVQRLQGAVVSDRGKMPGVEGGDYYTAQEAARILGRTDKPITERRIRQMLQREELEGHRDKRGRWHVAQHGVHRLMQERRQATPEDPSDGPENAAELLDRLLDAERRAARSEARLELTERAESTLQDERDRLLQELKEERAERRRLQERLEERERPWWRRMFGGG